MGKAPSLIMILKSEAALDVNPIYDGFFAP